MLLHGVAQVVLNLERDAATAVATEIGADEGHNPQAQQHAQPGHEWRRARQDHLVDYLTLN